MLSNIGNKIYIPKNFITPPKRYNPIPFPSSSVEAAIDSFGGFRKKKIDGKTFFIFYYSVKTAIYSDGDDLSFQPLFICPSLRLKVEHLKRKEEDQNFVPFVTPPLFSGRRSHDQEVQDMLYKKQVKKMLDSDGHDDICKLPLVDLFHEEDDDKISCDVCHGEIRRTAYYLCDSCGERFHKECVESPLEVKHPSYPFFSLQLFGSPWGYMNCVCCEGELFEIFYYCQAYNFSMHPFCALKPIPFVIDHPMHSHPLTFFPKQAYLPCNICGLIDASIPTYLCLPCVFVVHQNCIYIPHVIRVSRHHHRISFTSSPPPGNLVCGVCRHKVDNHYGAYSCHICDDYFVHTKCALRPDLWDGEDLEEEPEEDDVDVEPFERIADGIIRHFSHEHRMKLEILRVYDEGKFCQACVLPIYEGNYYSCIDQCNFILHEACANFPRKKYYPLHRHQLMLKVVTKEYDYLTYVLLKGRFSCDVCNRTSCGFVYECPKEECEFQLDVRCASVSEPFEYQGHAHPLYLSLKPEEERAAICQICDKGFDPYPSEGGSSQSFLNCIECEYIICFRCATLPYKARYKHDKHFLTFKEGKEGGDHSDWCDACEIKVLDSRKGGFYSCDDCCTTLHIKCLLGKDPYMKPGQAIKIVSLEELHVLRNNTMSRPVCHGHGDRCQGKIVFKNNFVTLCSMSCIDKLMASLVDNPMRANFGFKTLWESRDGLLHTVELREGGQVTDRDVGWDVFVLNPKKIKVNTKSSRQ